MIRAKARVARHIILVWFPRIVALPLIGIALTWGWVFGFTDFRAHQRVPMLIIAAATLVYAGLLVARNRWAVLLSIAFALLGVAVAIYMQVLGSSLNGFLIAVALLSLLYSGALSWALEAERGARRG